MAAETAATPLVPTLHTSRLRLTPFDAQADRALLFPIVADPEVMRFLEVEPLRELTDVDALLADYEQRVATGDKYVWAIRLARAAQGEDALLGACTFELDRNRRRAEVGYYLARRCWGQGFGKEAVRAIIDFGFGTQALNRIEALAYAENSGSLALLRALGFQQEGYLREHAWEKGRYWDDVIFALLRREWEQQGGVECSAQQV